MGVRIYKGTFYGAFIASEKYSKIEEIILNSGIVPSDWECLDPTRPNENEPIPDFEKINIVKSGNSVIGETDIFLGMKITGKDGKGLENEIEEAKKQLTVIFNNITPLQKDKEFRIETLEMIG